MAHRTVRGYDRSMRRSRYPRWVTPQTKTLDRLHPQNLREVGPNLYVGAEMSPPVTPDTGRWALIVDLCGSAVDDHAVQMNYLPFADRVVSAPFLDAEPIPEGHLDEVLPRIVAARGRGPVLVHCAAGLSRSASVAYVVLRSEDHLTHDEALRRVAVPGIYPHYPHPTVLRSARAWLRENL